MIPTNVRLRWPIGKKPTHQTVKSYEDKQIIRQSLELISTTNFSSGCLTRNLHLHIPTGSAKLGKPRKARATHDF